jgi:hypothetical protein
MARRTAAQPPGRCPRPRGFSALIVIWRIVDGMIAERWATIDTLTLLRQLDAIPAPAPAGD